MGHYHSYSQVRGKNLLIAIILNIVLTLAQILGGFISGSLALLSDALHNLSGVVAFMVSFVTNKFVRRDASLPTHFWLKKS